MYAVAVIIYKLYTTGNEFKNPKPNCKVHLYGMVLYIDSLLSFFVLQFAHVCANIYEQWRSGEASPTFGHANANFSVFIDRIRNQFLKK